MGFGPGQYGGSRRFVGRSADVEAARRLLLDPAVQVVSLIGPPGVGKTRLAVEVMARTSAALGDAVTFVPLADVREAAAVAALVAQRLGGTDPGGRQPVDVMAATIGTSAHLLVVDNFEHVADAAIVIAELVDRCPRLTVLATSRRPLSIRAERCIQLEPLDLPPAGVRTLQEARAADAVALMVELLTAIGVELPTSPGSIAALVEVCRKLDGLPLALELAAGRARVLPLEALAAALDQRLAILTRGDRDLPTRQHTMRAAVGWSYDLLEAPTAAVFRRLAVCVGGVAVSMASDLVGDLVSPGQALDALDDLVSGNLLRRVDERTGSRLVMLEVVREFAAEQLECSGEALAAHQRHAAEFLRLVEDEDPRAGGDQAAWLDRMQREEANLTAAIRWAVGAQDADTALRLCLSLRFLWYVRGSLATGRRLFDDALRVGAASPGLRARALVEASAIARHHGDFGAARDLADEAVDIAARGVDEAALASALLQLGFVLHLGGDYHRARSALERSRALFASQGDTLGVAKASHHLGYIAYFGEADLRAAQQFQSFALKVFQNEGNQRHLATALIATAELARAGGHVDRADKLLGEAFASVQALGDTPLLIYALHHAAAIASDRGHLNRAIRLLGAAEGLEAHTGAAAWPAVSAGQRRWLPRARAKLGEPRLAALRSDGTHMSGTQAVKLALALSDDDTDGLTAREHEVAHLVAAGLTNRAIAQRLVVSPRTVDGHVARILMKLEFTSRTQIAAWITERQVAVLPTMGSLNR